MIGRKFGRLTVISLNPWEGNGKNKKKYYDCVCECGGAKRAQYNNLMSGSVKSCGCLSKETSTKHGHYIGSVATPTRECYAGMIRRCYKPNRSDFHLYGGRGIKVCDRWLGDLGFINFLSDMGEKPEDLSLDRINVNGDYSPGNCRWATLEQQSRNTRIFKNNTSGTKGVSFNKNSNKWTSYIRLDGKLKYLGSFTEIEDAILARVAAEREYWL